MPSPTLALVALSLLASPALAGPLDETLGRTEVRIVSEPYPLVAGRTVDQMRLPERLERLGYERVRHKPTEPGQFFWGQEVFWVYRSAHRADGKQWKAELIGLRLGNDALVLTATDDDDVMMPLDGRKGRWLEPEVLAESIEGDRAPRVLVDIGYLPEHVYEPLLALEDSRFYDHVGLDGKSIARAMLANLKAGSVSQGGSTITQQLIKNRDLSPKRSLDRKASEAVRALALEAEYTKEEILECYLNTVYYGHVDGVAVHGLGTASLVFFDKEAHELTLPEAAVMAAVVQGPNGLSPIRHPEKAKARRDRAIDRMVELEWLPAAEGDAAKSTPIELHLTTPTRRAGHSLRKRVLSEVEVAEPRHTERQLGFYAQTTVDPVLQEHADRIVAEHLAALRRNNRRLRGAKLQAALVAVDASTGEVLAWTGGDPASPDHFDRVSDARRQPGSLVKPLVLLEAFDRCGGAKVLNPATRVSDAEYEVSVDGTTWSPSNYDGKSHGDVDLRTALRHSYNRPFARVAMHCGLEPTAKRFEGAGLDMPDELPLSLSLGSVETSPLQMVAAYSAFVDLGDVSSPHALARVERPGGRRLHKARVRGDTVSSDASAFMVRDMLDDVVDNGTGKGADVRGLDVIGKTGTSSGARDAWFVGAADRVVVAVWVGLDEGGNLGITGGAAAAPIFREFATIAGPTRAPLRLEQPSDVVVRHVNPDNGLLVRAGKDGAREEYFRRGHLPRRDQFWRKDPPELVIR